MRSRAEPARSPVKPMATSPHQQRASGASHLVLVDLRPGVLHAPVGERPGGGAAAVQRGHRGRLARGAAVRRREREAGDGGAQLVLRGAPFLPVVPGAPEALAVGAVLLPRAGDRLRHRPTGGTSARGTLYCLYALDLVSTHNITSMLYPATREGKHGR